jgi:hypothetical protein
LHWDQWPYCWTSTLNWQNTNFTECFSVCPWFSTLVTHNSVVNGTARTHFRLCLLDNRSLFWSLISPHEVRA